MTYETLALSLDRDGLLMEASWAYEVTLRSGEATLESSLNLVAIYLTFSDPGYFLTKAIDRRIADASYGRAMDVLEIAATLFGRQPELEFWRVHIRERVLGESLPNEVYERLAQSGATSAFVALFVATERREFGREAGEVFRLSQSADTARKRYLLSFQ